MNEVERRRTSDFSWRGTRLTLKGWTSVIKWELQDYTFLVYRGYCIELTMKFLSMRIASSYMRRG
jgi:hypothetical protein